MARTLVGVLFNRVVALLLGQAEASAYFVVAEALTNVVKHAGARQVRLELGRITHRAHLLFDVRAVDRLALEEEATLRQRLELDDLPADPLRRAPCRRPGEHAGAG